MDLFSDMHGLEWTLIDLDIRGHVCVLRPELMGFYIEVISRYPHSLRRRIKEQLG